MPFNGYGMSVDPNATAVFGLLQNGSAFQNPLSDSFNQVQQYYGLVAVEAATQLGLGNITTPQYNQINNSMGNMYNGVLSPTPTTGTPSYYQHTNDTVNNMPNNLSVARSAISVNQTMAPTVNPCSVMQDMFGSVLGTGATVLTGLIGLLALMLAKLVGGAILEVLTLLAEIDGVVAQIVDQVLGEIGALLNNTAIATIFGAALSILSFASDPCSLLVLAATGTSALTDILNID